MESRLRLSFVARWLRRAESLVLTLVAIVLIVLAVVLLANSVVSLINAAAHGLVRELAIEILDNVLLVMMTLELVYTVTVSIESHTLVAEPFLILGAIAAIRRMLVITAESTKLTSDPEAFRDILIELGMLALIVVAMAVSVYVMRRGQQYQPATREPFANEHES